MRRSLLAVVTCAAIVFSSTSPVSAAEPQSLGEVVFPNSGARSAQPSFIRGVLLLHNFEYDEARAAFRKAQRADPGFAMAYWGEALTHYHPLWFEKDSAAARAALLRLAATRKARAAKAKTPREKAYLASVEDLFATLEKDEGGKEDKPARDARYEKALRGLYDDEEKQRAKGGNIGVEAASLYALAILSSQQGVRDSRAYMRAASILERAYRINPKHPGVAHYLIHSYDDPVHAPLGVCAAETYADLAADAPHAKHMVSHIWQPLGRWAEVVESNQAAWDSSERRVAKQKLGSEARDWHALRFLQYGNLQLRRLGAAGKALDLVTSDARKNPSAKLRWHVLRMRAAQIIEAEKWDVPAYQGKVDDLESAAVAGDLFASGFAAVKRGDVEEAKAQLAKLGDPGDEDAVEPSHHHTTEAESKSERIAAIMRKQLAGLILFADGKREAGLDRLRGAAADADRLSFDYGPPNPVKPAYELLGETYLQLGDARKAMDSFQKALDRDPRRFLALRGLADAATKAGEKETAQRAKSDLDTLDRKPPRMCTR